MPVLVDPIQRYSYVRLAIKDWCHMAVDGDFEELHAFAASLGIPRSRFQGDHYDLVPWMRERATGSAIVYAATVRHVDALQTLFRVEGIPATSYHCRQRAQDRAAAQDAFMTGAVPVIIATNAFGMGIDKPDIRTVIHYDLPASLDIYYQESGRAGRALVSRIWRN